MDPNPIHPIPHPSRSLPALLQKSIMTSSTTTPNNIEKPISGVRAAKVTPPGGGLVLLLLLLLLSWLVLLLLLKSSDISEEAASALAGVRIRGMVEMGVLCVLELWWEEWGMGLGLGGCEKSRSRGVGRLQMFLSLASLRNSYTQARQAHILVLRQ